MRKGKKAVIVLLTVILGILAGLLFPWCQEGMDVVASYARQRVVAGWGLSANEDGKLYQPSVSLNGYMEMEARDPDNDARKAWLVQVYPGTAYGLSFGAGGVSNKDIDDVGVGIGSEESGRPILMTWQRSGKHESVLVNYLTTKVGHGQMIYRDLDGDGKWDIEDYLLFADAQYVMDSRMLQVDGEYVFVSKWEDRFATTCTITERGGSKSVVSLVDGEWKRIGDGHEPGTS